MREQRPLEFHLKCPASEALQRISDATAPESFPFIEPVRPKYRDWVGHVSGNKFRIWKWSARRRGRANSQIPMLRGEIGDTIYGCNFSASFVLHPFSRLWPPLAVLIFSGITATVWIQAHDLKGKLFAGFFLLFTCLLGFHFFSRRGRDQEEIELAQFVENLFRDLRT